MPQIAKIFIMDIPYHVDIAYSYYIPQSLEDSVITGGMVEVPFGKGNRKMTGVVVDITSEECDEKTKPISSVIGDGPVLTGELIGLCRFIKDYTLCTFGDAVRAVIPSAALSKVIAYYRVIPENERTSDIPFSDALEALGDRGRLVYSAAEKKQKFSRQYLQTELEFDCTGIIAKIRTLYKFLDPIIYACAGLTGLCVVLIIVFSRKYIANIFYWIATSVMCMSVLSLVPVLVVKLSGITDRLIIRNKCTYTAYTALFSDIMTTLVIDLIFVFAVGAVILSIGVIISKIGKKNV